MTFYFPGDIPTDRHCIVYFRKILAFGRSKSRSGKESRESTCWVALTQALEERLLEVIVDARDIKVVTERSGRRRGARQKKG